jgi:hypothetical protein
LKAEFEMCLIYNDRVFVMSTCQNDRKKAEF